MCTLQFAVLQYLICTGLHPNGALLVNLPGHRADLKMLSAHIYKHSHQCYYVYLITDKLSTTTLYLELHLGNFCTKCIVLNFCAYLLLSHDGVQRLWARHEHLSASPRR